jgi:tetratricopeptide (TPR) repeat protein
VSSLTGISLQTASLDEVLEIIRKILLLPGAPLSELPEPPILDEMGHYGWMEPIEAWCHYGRQLGMRGRHPEALGMYYAAIRETFVGLIEVLNQLASTLIGSGDPERALEVYAHALRLNDYLGADKKHVFANCALLLLELEQQALVPWAEQVYDRWIENLRIPAQLEAGRDDWIVEGFERIGRGDYAATVRTLLGKS